jgi:hypothetical protein
MTADLAKLPITRAEGHSLVGKRFGRWTVLGEHPERRRGRHWLCRCDCGTERTVRENNLRYGSSKSCGCCVARERNTRHGQSYSRVYSIWIALRQRCSNPESTNYANYGGRGITVCERWLAFENFYADMGDPPPGLSIDRIDNDGNYEPGNCQWATASEQLRNRRPSKRRKRRRSDLADIKAYATSLARMGMLPGGAAP